MSIQSLRVDIANFLGEMPKWVMNLYPKRLTMWVARYADDL